MRGCEGRCRKWYRLGYYRVVVVFHLCNVTFTLVHSQLNLVQLLCQSSSSMSGRTWPNIKVLRDIQRREAVQATELQRRAYLYLARNTALPTRVSRPGHNGTLKHRLSPFFWLSGIPQVRHQAQLALASRQIFPNKTRLTEVKDRCTETGRGRGVLSKGLPFGLCRVRRKLPVIGIQASLTCTTRFFQHQFKLKATRGELPGWQKASW